MLAGIIAGFKAIGASKFFGTAVDILKTAVPVLLILFLAYKMLGYIEAKGQSDVQIRLLQKTVSEQLKMIDERDKIIADDKEQKERDEAKIRELEEDLYNALEEALNANPEQSRKPALPADITKRLRDYWK